MQKVVGFFSKPENLFVLTLLIGLFTGTYPRLRIEAPPKQCHV